MNEDPIRYCPYCGAYGITLLPAEPDEFVNNYACAYCLNEFTITINQISEQRDSAL